MVVEDRILLSYQAHRVAEVPYHHVQGHNMVAHHERHLFRLGIAAFVRVGSLLQAFLCRNACARKDASYHRQLYLMD